jgi:site-specific DNA recombinase
VRRGISLIRCRHQQYRFLRREWRPATWTHGEAHFRTVRERRALASYAPQDRAERTNELGLRLSRSYFETILKNRFYLGYFVWQGVEYNGTHEPLISGDLFNRVHDVFAERNRPRHRKHTFAFAGLLRCAHDGCTVTAELQKGKYVYYRCSHGRGKCSLPYMREQEVSDRMGELLKGIYVPETIAQTIVDSLQSDSTRAEAERQKRIVATQQRIAARRARMDQMYEDKLDDEFWTRKMNEWQEQERELESELSSLKVLVTAESVLTVKRIFELANRAHFLYFTRNQADRGQLLKSVLLNCGTDGVSLWPVYRKPFDVIFERAKKQEWWAL